MSPNTAIKSHEAPYSPLAKADPTSSAFVVTGRGAIAFAPGVSLVFAAGAVALSGPISFDADNAAPGTDFMIFAHADGGGLALAKGKEPEASGWVVVGGFHYAPGGNAAGTGGGDTTPAINPYSCWDLNFRPACDDPSGMALVNGAFWCDIYLLNAQHRDNGCTSVFGEIIADGKDTPQRIDDGVHTDLNFETAKGIYAAYGKQLLGAEEFFAAAYGVTEKTAAGTDPKQTQLDAPRTSRFGIMQATGNMWTWGTDGHPDIPRASFFGGSWISGSCAGSRYASLDYWPELSGGDVGARGRSDHLNHG
ncbi:MAG TPA: hypothetical protein VN036_00605 [Devosia sp.]|nr:hypothetical protein [Devosia sp.]